MAFSRHGRGSIAELNAIASQIHPVFMTPPLAVSAFGGFLAAREIGVFSGTAALLHIVAIFFAVYTAHVKDGYVDFHLRKEDDDHPLTARGCRLLLAAATIGFFSTLVGVWWVAGIDTALVTLPTWLIAYRHAPQFDTNPIGATFGYPLGVSLSLVGGYSAHAGQFGIPAVGFSVVFFLLLSGVKVIDDAQDYTYDRSIAKRTIAVAIGPHRARRVADGLMGGALICIGVFTVIDVFPPGTLVAALIFGGVAVIARHHEPERATMLLIRGAYLFLAGLVTAVWFRPLA